MSEAGRAWVGVKGVGEAGRAVGWWGQGCGRVGEAGRAWVGVKGVGAAGLAHLTP